MSGRPRPLRPRPQASAHRVPRVPKVPSYLKGLAETRARVAAEVGQLTAVRDDAVAKLAKLQAELDACDLLIRKFDGRLNPVQIAPVRAWKWRYGKRGAMRAALIEHLKERAPSVVTTFELALAEQTQFDLEFATPADRLRWQTNSLTRELKRLVGEGVVERLHDVPAPVGVVGKWRWDSETLVSLNDLEAAAKRTAAATVR